MSGTKDTEDRRSKWTSIYWDVDPLSKQLRPYVRLTPAFMDLEAAGRPHGLMVGGFRDNLAEAKRFADSVDAFMEILASDIETKAALTTRV
jgi:hypothetical protein